MALLKTFSLASRSTYGPVSWLDRLRMCGHCQAVKAQVETVYNLGADVGNLDAPEGNAFTPASFHPGANPVWTAAWQQSGA